MNKPTPGPWHSCYRGIGWEVHVGASCGDECFCVNDGFRDTFTEPDARLISATPDLLKAARLAALNYKRTDRSHPELLGDDEHEAWSALNLAIRKAEGR
jgi:hypothetical protein